MLDKKQHLIIRGLLFTVLGPRFAAHIVEEHGRIPIVYYALDEGPWHCVVNLLQYMGGNHIDLDHAAIFLGPDTMLPPTPHGMCRFFNIQPKRSNVRKVFDPVHKARHYMEHGLPFATFRKVDPRPILDRQHLDAFRPKNLGAAPGVALKSPMQTHLHRIYMALAFHRVRTKFERNEQGLAIAAVIADATNGAVLTIAHNTKNLNTTYHAELNAVQAFMQMHAHQRNLPLILYSTLQPCPMCAAMISELLPNAMVFYGQLDPGKHMERMGHKPKFTFSMRSPLVIKARRGDDIVDLPVKALHGYDDWLGTRSHVDISTFLEESHQKLKDQGNHSVSRNLYTGELKAAIGNASRTLDRKLSQYDGNGEHRKQVQVDDLQRTQRRAAIQKVIRYLRPLFDHE